MLSLLILRVRSLSTELNETSLLQELNCHLFGLKAVVFIATLVHQDEVWVIIVLVSECPIVVDRLNHQRQ